MMSGGCFGTRRAKCFTKGSSKYPRDTQHALAPDASSLVLITPRSGSGTLASARRAEPDPAAAHAGGGGGMDDIARTPGARFEVLMVVCARVVDDRNKIKLLA